MADCICRNLLFINEIYHFGRGILPMSFFVLFSSLQVELCNAKLLNYRMFQIIRIKEEMKVGFSWKNKFPCIDVRIL